MTADAKGNDVTAVGVPVTGSLGFAPIETAFPTAVEGADPAYVLPAAFRKAGLFKEDGGFEWTLEPDGDPIVFFQEGYSIPSGRANVKLVVKLAQYDEIVRELSYGKVADANGYITIDGGGHATEYAVFTEEIFKNGVIRRRVAAGQVTGVKQDKDERGEVLGTELTFTIKRSASLNDEHIGEWLIPADAVATP